MRYLRPCGPYNNAKKESMLRKEGEVEMAEVLLQKMARNSTMKRAKLGDCFIPKYAMMWKESVIQQKFTHIYPLKSDQWSLLGNKFGARLQCTQTLHKFCEHQS
mmetsp:Transcript_40114/g.86526  ORF Transcript_40114/g.86526 Transcript_40114/m.86526 type:complete len:104 (-) Transcript_40114:2422-2733(-)